MSLADAVRLRSAPVKLPARPAAPRPGGTATWFLAVYVVLILLIPSQLVFKPLGAPGTPANLWGIAGLLWWCCVAVGGLDRENRCTPTRVASALFAATVLASYASGMMSGWYAPLTTRQQSDELWTLVPQSVDQISAIMVSSADRGLLSVAGWLGVVLVAAEGLRSWRDLESVVAWMVRVGAVMAGIGLVQFATGLDVVKWIQVPGLSYNSDLGGVLGRSALNRVSSTAVHPIEFGVAMACLFPFALHRTVHHWHKRSEMVPTALIFVGAFLSVSRSAILALAVIGLVLLAGWPGRWRVRAMVLAPLAVVGLRVAIPGLVGTLVALFTDLGQDPSVTGRTNDYAVVADVYEDHPWLGRGIYTFQPRVYRVLDNQWLGTLIELGVVGLVVVLAFILTAFFCARSAYRHAGTAQSQHLGLVLSAATAGAAVSMVTFDAWGFRLHAGMTFLVMGLAGAAWRLAAADRRAAVSGGGAGAAGPALYPSDGTPTRF